MESIQEVIEENKNKPYGTFLWFIKAHDVLNHKILLSKWDDYVIRGTANLWFKSHLQNQKVCWNKLRGTYQEHSRKTNFSFKVNSMLCVSTFNPRPNFIYIIYIWLSNKYARGRDNFVWWWYKSKTSTMVQPLLRL